MMYNVITASKEQIDKLHSKHLSSVIYKKSFSYNEEDEVGFVTLRTITCKQISYQLRGEEPCFVEFTGFGNIRYDVDYPAQSHKEMYDLLKKYGVEVKNAFWKGAQI